MRTVESCEVNSVALNNTLHAHVKYGSRLCFVCKLGFCVSVNLRRERLRGESDA